MTSPAAYEVQRGGPPLAPWLARAVPRRAPVPWPNVTPDALVGLLAEPERLRVVAALILGARTPSELIESVVRTFVRDGRLLRLPAQRSRRCMVLKHVVQAFEPGVRYTEKEVDAVLRTWCAGGTVDHVSLRRFLVDEGLVTREAGQYWRSGGWVDVLGG